MKLSRGVAYMIASAAAFSVMSTLVNLAARRLPVGELVLARGVVTLLLSYWSVRKLPQPWGHAPRGLVLRGVLGFFGLTCYYIALARLPLAEATTLHFTTPMLTALLAWWMLGERLRWPTALALALGFAGVAIVSDPQGGALDPLGVAVALTGAMFSALAYVQVRRLTAHEDPRVIVFYFPLVATPLALPWAAWDAVMPTALEVAALVGIGVSTQLGQVFLTRGLAAERAGTATAVGYVQVAFAIGWGQLLFDQALPATTVVGALVVGAAVLLLAFARPGSAAEKAPDAKRAHARTGAHRIG